MKIRNIIATEAFSYYEDHEFEPTPEVIPLMRVVVEGTRRLEGGLYEVSFNEQELAYW